MAWPFVAFGLLILYLSIGVLVSCWMAYMDETDKPLIRFVIFWPLVLIYMVITYATYAGWFIGSVIKAKLNKK